MSLLSADTLFHYTKKEHLISILKDGFSPRYSKEFDSSKNERLTLGNYLYIPMVCFCDTPLSMVNKHMDVYGDYAIGLNKEWAKRNALNPVFYINQESTVHKNLIESFHLVVLNSMGDQYMSANIQKLLYIYRYMKPYKAGSLYEKNKIIYENYSYYDEKEWRYVPEILSTHHHEILYSENLTDESIELLNNEIKSYMLKFSIRDINFIIVNNSNDVDDILKAVNESTILSSDDTQYLLTTIVTTDQIRKNF